MTDTAPDGAAHVSGRRTQAERSERTRGLLLDATIDCLVERGYSRTSVHEICKRAAVSRGAQQHHFATRAHLMASAVEHLAIRLRAEVLDASRTRAKAGTEDDPVSTGIDLLWQAYSGKLSTAVVELWVAARTDPELRAAMSPVDRALGRSTLELYRGLVDHGPSVESASDDRRTESLFWLTVNLVRGLALDAEIGGNPARRQTLLAEWKRIAARIHREQSAAET